MSWNHRVLAHKEGEVVFLAIHEVYYDKDGVPESYTESGISVGAESLGGLNWVLSKMQDCVGKPILSVENFPKEYNLIN